ncbi:hypothetical protein GYMLUDRAFT_49357 [Collybiopsis luxurians FD-317 M1]|uniref:Uncharacterized protein n=1 Tax=Collybiopsis luxurians FD-317 M1 TaxID=944289 RepID=A0A0D0C670_9AGAR|nr:hypothetical protein GYMLUDRAFT_49357 [Collybiopsis luxurians FD-317 M1]
MESTSTIITAATAGSDSTDESTSIQELLRRALLEYDAHKQNRGLRFQSLEPQAAQQLVDYLQSVLDSRQHDSNDHTKYFSIFRYLSRRFQILPSSLVIRYIKREGLNPVAGGGFADIWRGTWKKKPVCLKVLRLTLEPNETKRDKIRKEFCHEALVWRQLHHPNILPLLGVNSDLFHPSFCLISPWMENRDINTFLKQNPLHSLPSVLHEVAAGLHYLHSREPPLIHGDIRGGNILVNDDLHCCLADFGLTLVTTGSQVWSLTTSSSSSKGSMRWLAPEYIDSSGPTSNHTSRDVYAFACTIVELLTQKPPFHDYMTDYKVMNYVMYGGRPTRPQNVWCPDVIWDLTTQCWAPIAQDRPSTNKILNDLQGVLSEEKAAVEKMAAEKAAAEKQAAEKQAAEKQAAAKKAAVEKAAAEKAAAEKAAAEKKAGKKRKKRGKRNTEAEKEANTRQISMSGGGSHRGGDRAEQSSADDRTISNGGTTTFGPSSVLAGNKGDKRKSLSRTNSSTNMLQMLQNVEASEVVGKSSLPPSRKASIDLGSGGAPEPAPQRKRLILQPRLRPLDQDTAPSTESDSEFDEGVSQYPEQEMSEAEAKKKIDEDIKEFFGVRDLDEAEVYFAKLPVVHHHALVDKLVSTAIESKEADATLVGRFFQRAASKKLVSSSALEEGFLGIAEFLDDIAIDAPKATDLYAIMIKGADLSEEQLKTIASKSAGNGDKLLDLVSS